MAFLSPIVTFYRPIATFFAIYENRVSKTRFSAQFFSPNRDLKTRVPSETRVLDTRDVIFQNCFEI